MRAVIYALGVKERVAMLWEQENLFSDSTKALLSAIDGTGVRRVVFVTGFSVFI